MPNKIASSEDSLSEYEILRMKNIAERKALLEQLDLAASKPKPKVRRVSRVVEPKVKRIYKTRHQLNASIIALPTDKNEEEAEMKLNDATENVTLAAMLKNVCHSSVKKVYSKAGTTCHKCRQTSLDQKTICRSGYCVGQRGAFCGICIRMFGETAELALRDPGWICPPCREVCKCTECVPFVNRVSYGHLLFAKKD